MSRGQVTCQILNDSNCKLECKEGGIEVGTLVLFMCEMNNPKYDRSCDPVACLCGRFIKLRG